MRAFVAVPVPAGLHPALAALQAHLTELPALDEFRWIPVQNLHLTLRFLGEVDEDRVPDIEAALRAAVSGARAVDLPLERFGVFPHLKRPNVLWTGPNETPASLTEMAGVLNARLEEAGFPREEGARPFAAHLTLARRRVKGRPPAGLEGELEAAEGRWLRPPPQLPVREAALYRSELQPRGAIYTAIHTERLPL